MEEITVTKKENKALFNNLRFVALAISDDETRAYMMVLHVEDADSGKVLVGTDGHRLHTLTTVLAIDNGDYTVDMTANYIRLVKHEADIPFVNWRRVIPETKKTITLVDGGLTVERKALHGCLYPLYRIGVKVNEQYIADLDFDDSKQCWSVRQCPCDKKAAMVFENGIRKAIIMPMNFDNDFTYPLEVAVKQAIKTGDKPCDIAKRMAMTEADVTAIIGTTATVDKLHFKMIDSDYEEARMREIEAEEAQEQSIKVRLTKAIDAETAIEEAVKRQSEAAEKAAWHEPVTRKRKPRKEADKPVKPERGVWTPNRNGTKQTMICKW
jgi:hypothetical protein